jgi:hypothetical protein
MLSDHHRNRDGAGIQPIAAIPHAKRIGICKEVKVSGIAAIRQIVKRWV